VTIPVYIETTGCQMNKLDSELVADTLQQQDCRIVPHLRDAQAVLINTCSVRRHAEEKVFSRLGHFHYHQRRFGSPKVIAVIGCMAQRIPETIRSRCPFVDIVCGPGRLYQIGKLVKQALLDRPDALTAVDDFRAQRKARRPDDDPLEQLDLSRQPVAGVSQAYVRAQRGCDNFCSYCVVPYARGPQRSRPPQSILQEVRQLADAGCVEITLLGQTINSYKYTHNGTTCNLADLLYRVHEITGPSRIRFITSYPADFNPEIFHAMADLERVCPYLHMPAQSGSNRILRAMNRKYTTEQYLELISTARRIVTGISFAGDFIVGFPGETEKDFQASLDLLQQVRYKNCFLFKYSVRDGTAAARRHTDDVPPAVKQQRLQALMDAQNHISLQDNRQLIGSSVEVLTEGPSKRQRHAPAAGAESVQLTGRTITDKIVVFDGPQDLTGKIVTVEITDASPLTLFARLADSTAVL